VSDVLRAVAVRRVSCFRPLLALIAFLGVGAAPMLFAAQPAVELAPVINTFAGTGTSGDTGDGGLATSAEISPTRIAPMLPEICISPTLRTVWCAR
jgi:hypothetical protein